MSRTNSYQPTAQTLEEYFSFVAEGAFDPHANEQTIEELQYICLGLAGETGEFIDQVKKLVRDEIAEPGDDMRDHLIEELGDIMWYMTRLMINLDITLYGVIIRNTLKLYERHKERFPGTPWPFSDPHLGRDYIQEQLENVCVDEKV